MTTVDELALPDRFDFEPVDLLARGSTVLLAARLGVSPSRVRLWRRSGVPWWRADEIAVCLGYHPSLIWPNWHLLVAPPSEGNDDA